MNETKKYDIAVVGAGPAGALLCSLLSKNYSVIVFDRQGEGSDFEKPCGGLLSEAAQEAFAKLSINIPEEILTTPQIYSVRTLDVAETREAILRATSTWTGTSSTHSCRGLFRRK